MYSLDDTISAISTSIGKSGVGIIKISGPESYIIAEQIFHPYRNISKLEPHRLHYGKIIDPVSQTPVDEALVVYMPQPHSYTRQDVIEIQSHGSFVALQQILQLTLRLGARLAGGGEMTLRAFLNGRLDLAQAEAVLDVIEAKTEAALRVATEQLGGTLSTQISSTRRMLIDILAFLEASIDFVEDEIPEQDIIVPLAEIITKLEELLQMANRGLIYRQGIHAAIVGRPNVGKSSLLNALLRGNRAIVTDIPGTTRDTLEETVNINNIPLVLVDTAGIRTETSDEVERIGVERSRAAIERADIVLMVIDGSQRLQQEDFEIAILIENKPTLLIINKSDLPTSQNINISKFEELASVVRLPSARNVPDSSVNFDSLSTARQVRISALKKEGITDLEQEIVELVMGEDITISDTPLVSNPRHKALIEHALTSTKAAIIAQENNLSPDLVSIDVRTAVDALGEITGETVTEDLLDTIFSKFCIGK